MNSSAFTICCQAALTIEACIRHHAPLFDRYIVVEGAALPGHDNARGDGRRLTGGKPNSTDGTVEILKQLEKEFSNLKVIYAKDCWQGKTEMVNAGLQHAMPGVLWQIDSDEAWRPRDIETINSMFWRSKTLTDAQFFAFHFWGDTEHHAELKPFIWGQNPPWHRVFRFEKWQVMESHEPPKFRRGVNSMLDRNDTSKMGIFLYHYTQVHRSQVEDKETFYNCKGDLLPEWDEWQKTKPLTFSSGKLVKFKGQHPINTSFLKAEAYANAT